MKIKVFSEDNRNDCLRVRFKKVCCAFGVFSFLGVGMVGMEKASAIDLSTDIIINPIYQQYEQDVKNGEGDKWKVVPNKYIYSGENNDIAVGKGGESLPSAYNLVDEGYGTRIKNQGGDDICWAFTTITAIESNLKKVHGIDVELSPKQLDYLMSEGTPYHDYMKNEIGIMHDLGKGSNFVLASFAFDGKYAPVLEKNFFDRLKLNDENLSSFSSWKEYQDNALIKELFVGNGFVPYTEPLNSSEVMGDVSDYVVTKYRLHSNAKEDNLVNKIKSEVYNYGASYVSMFAPGVENCWDADTKTIVDNGAAICDAKNGHSMAIIGWDDNHTYKDPMTGQTKTGAFLMQNSWGESSFLSDYGYDDYDSIVEGLIEFGVIESEEDLSDEKKNIIEQVAEKGISRYEYVWLGYDYKKSTGDSIFTAASIQDVKENDYANIYETVGQGAGASVSADEGVSEIINSFSTGGNAEYVDAVSVDTHAVPFVKNVQYVFYIDSTNTGNDYQEVGTAVINATEVGKETIELSNKVKVDGDFKVKLVFKDNGQAGKIGGEYIPYITMSVYTKKNSPVPSTATTSEEIIGVPNTGLFTNGEWGAKNIIILAFGVVGMFGMAFVIAKKRKEIFHRIKFDKK